MSSLPTVQQSPKGLVDPAAASRTFRLARYLPSGRFAAFLDHYWVVEWDMTGKEPYVQRTLPFPCVNVVFDARRSGVFGVTTGAFDYRVEGIGKVLGLRFRPGAFRAFLNGRSASAITDEVLPFSDVFPWNDLEAERAVLSGPGDTAMVDAANALLLPCLPQPDPQVERIGRIIAMVEQAPGLMQVDDLAASAGISVRALQQLFSDYVGVSPKWVIRRYRLQEAAARLAGGDEVDLAGLAQSLGYFDQAHFTSDFHRLVGRPPAQYRRGNMA
jgi:AraC-like DNA-binding protein